MVVLLSLGRGLGLNESPELHGIKTDKFWLGAGRCRLNKSPELQGVYKHPES